MATATLCVAVNRTLHVQQRWRSTIELYFRHSPDQRRQRRSFLYVSLSNQCCASRDGSGTVMFDKSSAERVLFRAIDPGGAATT